MAIGTLVLFLLGNRQAIREIAADRRAIWPGMLFVLSAGLAREYDGADLLKEPWHLLIPFAASIGSSFLLFLLVCGRFVFEDTPNKPSFFAAYRAFLTLFWMTAPLAWLYAIPYERFLPEVNAVSANLWTLALVAAWRVFIMVRVISTLTDINQAKAFIYIIGYSEILILVAIYMMPKPLIEVMGGIRHTASERVLFSAMFMVGLFSLVTGAIFFWIGCLYFWTMKNPLWIADAPNVPGPSTQKSVWLLAIASVLIWIPFLPGPQAEQRLKSQVETLMAEGRIAESLDLMSAHARKDFPPLWMPPPQIITRKTQPSYLDIMESLYARNDATWVQEAYEDGFSRYLGDTYALIQDETLNSNLERVFNLIEVSSHRDEMLKIFDSDLRNISGDKSHPLRIRERAKELLSMIEQEE